MTITVTVAEAGALSFTWTITGCAASPSSGTSGTAQAVTIDSSCTYTISSGSTTGNGTLRARLTSSYVTSVSETSCSSGTCSPVSLTAHVQELLAIGSNCNTPLISVASPTSDRWYDYGTTLTVTCNGVWGRSGGTGTRAASWNWNGGTNTAVATTSTFISSAETMNSHHTFNVNIVTQYQLTLDAGATQALAAVTSPTITSDKYWYDSGAAVTYKGYGVFHRANGSGNRSTSWYLDSGVPTTLSSAANSTVAVTMTSPHTIHVTTVPQWQVSLDSVSTKFLKTISAPTIANDRYWYDTGTKVTVILNGTGSRTGGVGMRLVSYAINGGTSAPVATTGTVTLLSSVSIVGKEFITGVSTTQYQLTLDAGATGALVTTSSPSIPGDNYWYDSGTQVTYMGNGVFARSAGTGTRLSSWWWDSTAHTSMLTTGTFPTTITMSAPHALHTQTVAQCEVTLTGTYGVSSATSSTISGDDYWYDSGTVVSLSLQGNFGRTAGTGWRMVSYAINSGPAIGTTTGGAVTALNAVALTSPQTISVQAVKQYQVTFDQAITTALNSITAPTLTGDNYWYNAGSAVTITVHGVWGRTPTEGYRLSSYFINGAEATSVASSGTVTILNLAAISAPQSMTSNATTQYFLTVNGGAGATYSVPPPVAGDTGWYDSGTTLGVSTNGTYDSEGSTRQRIAFWSIDSGQNNTAGNVPVVTTSMIVMNGPHSVSFYSVTQYDIAIVVKDNGGTDTLSPDSLLMSINGRTQSATAGAVWADSGSTVSVSSIIWHGLNVAPSLPAQYTVSSAFTIVANTRVYDATIVVKDPLGFVVGGADATITLANGTTVHRSAGGDGTIMLRMIPLGTYQATISALGFSSALSGDASVQSTAVAHLPLSWPVILVIVVIVALAIIGIVFVRKRR